MKEIRRIQATEARAIAQQAGEVLALEPGVRLVFLFGSAVEDGVESVRDVDLAILTDPPLELEEFLRLRARVVLEVGGPIDLVNLDDASILLRHQVAQHGRCLYADPPDAEIDFLTSARSRYWDFKPVLETSWRLIAERQEERARGLQE